METLKKQFNELLWLTFSFNIGLVLRKICRKIVHPILTLITIGAVLMTSFFYLQRWNICNIFEILISSWKWKVIYIFFDFHIVCAEGRFIIPIYSKPIFSNFRTHFDSFNHLLLSLIVFTHWYIDFLDMASIAKIALWITLAGRNFSKRLPCKSHIWMFQK